MTREVDALDVRPDSPARVVVAFGSNLGDRGLTIERALEDLRGDPDTEVVRVSPVYESIAVTTAGPDPDAPTYLNGVVVMTTRLSPRALLEWLHTIEVAHGRVRAERWGSRTLDLDIIDFEGVVSDNPDLTLPHPCAGERAFVLVPWLDVDPTAMLGLRPVRTLPASQEPTFRMMS